MKYCMYCGHQLEDEDMFCTSCGNKQEVLNQTKIFEGDEDIIDSDKIVEAILESQKGICKNCGNKLIVGALFCNKCGTRI